MAKRKDEVLKNLKRRGEQEETSERRPLLDASFAADLERSAKLKGTERQMRVGQFLLKLDGLEYVGDEPTLEDWLDVGKIVRHLNDSIQWMIVDWLEMSADRIHDWIPDELAEPEFDAEGVPEGKYKYVAQLTGYSYGRLRNVWSVGRRVPMSLRKYTEGNVSFAHFEKLVAAGLSEGEMAQVVLDLSESPQSVAKLSASLGLGAPPSKTPAIVKNVEHISRNWRMSFKRVDRATQQDVVNQLRVLLDEMEAELNNH